jgi:hypothetical protein
MRRHSAGWILLLALIPAAARAQSRSNIGPALDRVLRATPDRTVAAWVYFTDRGGDERDPAAFAAARTALTQRALDRRLRRGSLSGVTESDLPVHASYVRALIQRGARLRGTSRWLNAASVEIPARLATEFARLPFVQRVEQVESGWPLQPVGASQIEPAHDAGEASSRAGGPAIELSPGDTAYYGATFKQLSMMQVPQLHALGLSGAGVLVCMLDSGFHLTHQAFAGLSVVATRDFVDGDTNVDDEPGQDAAGANVHGTATLGCVGGHLPGVYSGGAFGASFALAKTERISTETPSEMDYWQFGAEWADSLGADVISSSLGYSEFDAPYASYTYANMDGRTTVVTLAAVEAMRRGITVVNAAGNEGATSWFYIIAPGDADSIITSGAVDSFNVVANFSSHGPTSDGRTKPDVTAMGRSDYLISTSGDASYMRASGTSFSTPLTAGLVALLLESHPTWRPVDVRDALRATALNHANPDNTIGWGLVQGLAANAWSAPVAVPPGPAKIDGLSLSIGPNPLRSGVTGRIRFSAPAGSNLALDVIDVAGRSRARLFSGAASGERGLEWRGADENGAPLAAGIYWLRLASSGAARAPSVTTRVVVLP